MSGLPVPVVVRLAPLAAQYVDRAVLDRYADVRGIRIEDDVLVTPSGHEVLTAAAPKSIEELERLCAR